MMASSHVVNRNFVRKLVNSWLSRERCWLYPRLTLEAGRSELVFLVRTPGIIAGLPFVGYLFAEFGCGIHWHVTEGKLVNANTKVATATGDVNDLRFCEPLAVRILSRASGIATYAQKLLEMLLDAQWEGVLLTTQNLTPGFGLVEEHAMLLGGLTFEKSSVHLRHSDITAAGDVQKAIDAVRSTVSSGMAVKVECDDLSESRSAAEAGADVVVFSNISAKNLPCILTQLKSAYPLIKVQLDGTIDESNLKALDLSNVDFMTTSKLTNGYPVVDFQASFVSSVFEDNDVKPGNVEEPASQSSARTNAQSPDPDSNDDLASSTASTPKKLRLGDDAYQQSDSAKPGLKQNGTSICISNPPNLTPHSNALKEANLKRPLRSQRPQLNAPKPSARSQSPGGIHLLQMSSSRFGSPAFLPSRTLGNQITTNISPMSSVLNAQNMSNIGHRMPGHSVPQRVGPMALGMLGNSPNVGPGFLGSPSYQPNWPMMPMGPGPLVGGVGLGLRVGGPGGSIPSNCRACGATGAPGLPFCRNCRVSFR